MLKKIMIPVAALAITVTTASAFTGTDWTSKLSELGLTDTEIAAIEEAQQIKEEAREAAEQVLADAGIDEEQMREIHDSMREAHKAAFEPVKAAIEANDYSAFVTAVADTPFAESIDSEADFTKLVEAHELRAAGDVEAAQAIMTELGLPMQKGEGGMRGFGGRGDASAPVAE